MTIFISVASYRDPELVPTIEDCLRKAIHPEALRFGISWQHGPEEGPLPFAGDGRFRILDVDWRDSRGACWARAEVMSLYAGEDYFLQLDSHHRFVEGWDEEVLAQLARTGSEKPVLTTYATPFSPGDPTSFGAAPMQMNFDRFTPEGIVLFRPAEIPGWREREQPVRARFLSAHFLFAPGAFVREVPYDPELYFTGEEITLAVRAFTHGWDLFHPTRIIVWHEYSRAYRPHKHWSDHRRENGIQTEWHERDVASRERVRRFLEAPWVGPLGLGEARTFADYEAYAGLRFKLRRAHEYTRRDLEPPNPPASPEWAERIARWDMDLALDRALLPPEAAEARFWYVAFHDANEEEIFREDASAEEVRELVAAAGPHVRLRRSFESEREPASWTVWPCSEQSGWLDKVRGPVVVGSPHPATFVTALVDLGRDSLDAPWARSFEEHYLPRFARLLAIDAPMIVYVEPERERFVWQHRRRDNTRVVLLGRDQLEALPFFARVQEIRERPDWSAQAAWLAESPQARLPHYNPLVLSKMLRLRDAARDNPFGTEAFFWIDAGLSHTVREGLLHDPALPARLSSAARDLVFVAYPYRGLEVHGFPATEMSRFAGAPVEHVVRGGLFGGRGDAVLGVGALYDALLRETLAAGCMGTEESLLAILAARHPALLRPFLIGEDGLLFPFLEALLTGRAEAMRAPARGAPFARPVALGLLDEDREGAAVGETRFLGLRMQQNRNAPFALEALARHLDATGVQVKRIVEIGTGTGGFTVLLQLYCASIGAELITYDIAPRVEVNPAFERLGIELRKEDVRHEFVVDEIARELQKEGVSIVVCDGGDKARDAAVFADRMKPGDYLLAHDYAPSTEVFEREMRGRLWSWCELTDRDLAGANKRNGLDEVLPELLHPAAWTCRVKRGRRLQSAPAPNVTGRKVALYAITYNLPDQLRLWLESVERTDPEMLSRTDKFLLDNSTDPSTTAAYDALCARYGFSPIRRGNLGITGGRIACAHHFASLGAHDAMLYFEDDMLLADEDGLCANGFRTHVPDLFGTSLEILRGEPGLDFLKLSFTEFFGDHRVNWAFRNLGEEARGRLFPDGDATRVQAIKSHGGLAYLLGEVHYSNWPMLITRRGSDMLFPSGEEIPRHEQGMMVRALELGRSGALHGGVLLASPIRHHRAHHYRTERKES